jgi:hypothetical protein
MSFFGYLHENFPCFTCYISLVRVDCTVLHTFAVCAWFPYVKRYTVFEIGTYSWTGNLFLGQARWKECVKPGIELPPLPPRLVEEGELGPIVNVLMNKVTRKPGNSKSKGGAGNSGAEGQDYGRGKRSREVINLYLFALMLVL